MARGKKTGGRVKGTPNKFTADVRIALSEAFKGIGGVEALTAWAKRNKAEFYRLWVKLLPPAPENTGGGIQINLLNLTAHELDRLETIAARTILSAANPAGTGPTPLLPIPDDLLAEDDVDVAAPETLPGPTPEDH